MPDGVESTGMNPTKEVFGRKACKCQRCPHVWLAEGDEDPKRCPRCKSSLWNTPRKQKRGPKPGAKQKRPAKKRKK